MPAWRIPRIVSVVLVCSFIGVLFVGCGKKMASSTGDTASTSKNKSTVPVETIKPETMATVPEERSASSPLEAGREPMASGAPGSRGAGGGEPDVPGALSAPAASAIGEGATLADIFFDFDQHSIRGDAQSTLSANADWINRKVGKAVVIEGHCDERGTQAYNLVLGDKRARSAKRYLEDLGVPASRLKTTSYGELRPFCKEHDESCYQQNRRAHFVAQ
jgi:peptidoglycan-associated lipoprotein